MRTCSTCKQRRECRPYGENAAWICYDCAMQDRETTDKMARGFAAIFLRRMEEQQPEEEG